MQNAKRDMYRARLQALAQRIRLEVSSITDETQAPSGGQSLGSLTNAPMHLADMGTEEYLHGINAVLLENGEHLINEVRAALERIDADLFGGCEYCGGIISDERLDAMPYARYCVQCAEAQAFGASANINDGRPNTPADTLAPEGDMHEDRRPRPRTDWEAENSDGAIRGDSHAAGTAGGGTALGGLAGGTAGCGEPDVAELDDALGSGDFDAREERDRNEPQAGRSGGAVGGTPAGKRVKPR